MNTQEVIGFFIPDYSDYIQAIFSSVLALMVILTILCAHRIATPSSWEKKWNGGTPGDSSDDLDIEHGSVTDLWHAVATAPEKLLEVMPGMMLVVGLLGTFIGLGLALDHASNILGHPSAMSATGAVNSMQDLLGLLQGLGTKFKTSTWGILGFVILKTWSEWARFEEKRLVWVISKVKAEIIEKNKLKLDSESKSRHELHSLLSDLNSRLIGSFNEAFNRALKHDQHAHLENAELLANISASIKQVNEELSESNHSAEKLASGQILAIEKAIQKQTSALERISDKQTQIVDSRLERIEFAATATNNAMTDFTGSTQQIVSKMADAGEKMASGATLVGKAAESLVSAVDSFSNEFTDVLNKVRNDLGEAINGLSEKASETLERGSLELAKSSQGIALALAKLSADVENTMREVASAVNKALDIQKRVGIEFTNSMQALDEKIRATTTATENLGKSILEGLRAISTSNRGVVNANTMITKSVDSLGTISKQLEVLSSQLSSDPPITAVPSEIKRMALGLEELRTTMTTVMTLIGKLNISESIDGKLSSIESYSKELLHELQMQGRKRDNVSLETNLDVRD